MLPWHRIGDVACVCAPSDVPQSELGLSRVNKWYQHGLRGLQRLRAFARSRLIPTPFSCFLLIKKVEKKGKRKNNAIMQARGWLFISLTFNTVSYIYFYDVTDGGEKTKKQTRCNILMEISASGHKNQSVLLL